MIDNPSLSGTLNATAMLLFPSLLGIIHTLISNSSCQFAGQTRFIHFSMKDIFLTLSFPSLFHPNLSVIMRSVHTKNEFYQALYHGRTRRIPAHMLEEVVTAFSLSDISSAVPSISKGKSYCSFLATHGLSYTTTAPNLSNIPPVVSFIT